MKRLQEGMVRIDVSVPPELRAAILKAAAEAGYTSVRPFLRELLIKKFGPAKKVA